MFLFVAILALLSGPLLFEFGRLGNRTRAFLDGFAFITIAGLFLFGILPEAIEAGGYSRAILEAAACKVLALDRDPTALAAAEPLLAEFAGRLRVWRHLCRRNSIARP